MGAGKLYDIGFVSSQTISGGAILSNNLTVGSVSNTEFGYLDGVTSAIQTQLDTKASIANYIASTTALSLFAGSANINRTYVDTISGNSLDKYYPSSLGRGVSGAVYPLTEWFIESGEKLSTISGSLSDRIAALEGASEITWLSLETVSSNAISAYNWTSTSGSILPYPSSVGAGTSGTVASLVLFSSNSRSLYYPSALGKGVSGQLNAHTSDATIHFTKESLDDDYAGSSNINRALLDAISGNLDTRIDAISFNPENYITSSNALELFADSSNIQSKFILSDSYTASGAFYPSSLGKGVSGAVYPLTEWFIASSSKLSASGALAHPRVTLAGVPNYITISDQEITRAKLDLNDDTNFTAGLGITLATNTVSVTDYIASAGALDKFAGSSVTSLTNKWFIESGEKLSTISGGLSSRINAVTGLNGATASTNFFLATSGNTLWSWYSISASKLSESGNKYSDVYS
jgi:hypothetical protein